jgi:diketogulonate reductase-like aldo/keto reductase
MNEKNVFIKLNNGVQMPALGLGVLRSSSEETPAAVETAIHAGYRLIDTAAAYLNEREVGDGIRRSGIKRSDMFVTTKLWLTHYGYDTTLRAFESSLRKLRFDYLDLYLLHWPVPATFDATAESYRAAEKLLADGRVRAIGVCNFSPQHLKNLMEHAEITPAVNQVELHPSFNQRELREFDRRFGITTQSWAPIGGSIRRAGDAANDPLHHPTILQLATKYRKTPAQIVLRWHIDHGLSAIPKSVKKERIEENIDIFNFALTVDDMATVDALDTGVRSGPDPEVFDANTYPIKVED